MVTHAALTLMALKIAEAKHLAPWAHRVIEYYLPKVEPL